MSGTRGSGKPYMRGGTFPKKEDGPDMGAGKGAGAKINVRNGKGCRGKQGAPKT